MNKVNYTDIREANISDAAGLVRVSVESWRSTYAGIIPQEFLDSLTYEGRTRHWEERLSDTDIPGFTFVAKDSTGGIIGYAGGLKGNSGNRIYTGEVGDIYLLKESQRQGTGRRLMATVALRLKEYGHSSLLVWVLEDNPYRKFYEALDGQPAGEKVVEIGGRKLAEVAYGWLNLNIFEEIVKSD
ncbi:MAG: GNAT family N-acetyltransferase [Dehalococcoidales bacterium]|nr:MAG: GNAT family N-acetyltransferase [Dehalococcoidales bacterium]